MLPTLVDDPICPSGLPKLRVSFSYFLIDISTCYAYFCAELFILTAYFETEFSTPHPSFQPILGPCINVL